MTTIHATALEGLGVGLFAVGLGLVVGVVLASWIATAGVALIVVGIYCAIAANVLSGDSDHESGTGTSNPSDPAQRS